MSVCLTDCLYVDEETETIGIRLGCGIVCTDNGLEIEPLDQIGRVASVGAAGIPDTFVDAGDTITRTAVTSWTNENCGPVLVHAEWFAGSADLSILEGTVLNYRAAGTIAVNAPAPGLSDPVDLSESAGQFQVSTQIATNPDAFNVAMHRALFNSAYRVVPAGQTVNARIAHSVVCDVGTGRASSLPAVVNLSVIGRA